MVGIEYQNGYHAGYGEGRANGRKELAKEMLDIIDATTTEDPFVMEIFKGFKNFIREVRDKKLEVKI